MRIVFSGAEVGSNRNLLFGQKVESMGLNYCCLLYTSDAADE